jgi:general L-amino acid transport system permease protein
MATGSHRIVWSWRNRALRGVVYQVAAVAALVALIFFLVDNTLQNMRLRGIRSGFDFLFDPAGFDVGESAIPFTAGDPYWKAFLVGLANTLRVALIGIFLATVLGVLVGVGRLSRNALLRWLCAAYVECFRNLPILLQLLMWYFVLTALLPPASEALQIGSLIYLSKSGLVFPLPLWSPACGAAGIGFLLGVVAAWLYARRTRKLPKGVSKVYGGRGQQRSRWLPAAGFIVAGILLGGIAGGPIALDVPQPTAFNIAGGAAVTPEFLAVLIGLTLYTAAFIAEIVRSGIQSVPWGQIEAANALGLSRRQTLKLIVLPQAMRVVIPPTANQYLNLTKNSSLAVAIGYPDLVSITNTSLNQTGRAVECIAVMMAIYLVLSLTTAFFMSRHNAKAAIRES